jgi:hypothetical protein
MWLYPVPALIALVGWIFVAITPEQRRNIGAALVLLLIGLVAYFLRARVTKSWPLSASEESARKVPSQA